MPSRVSAGDTEAAPTDAAIPSMQLPVTVTSNVAFTKLVDCGDASCSIMLDVFAPATPGPWPVVVLLRGGPGGLGARASLDHFATATAARGIVVFNADYRDSLASGGGFPRPFDDVACAIRFARANATMYGGDPRRVTLAGHSLGAFVGAVVALADDAYGASCLSAQGSGKPDSFVGIAGPYDLAETDVHDDLASVLGGEPSALPDAWSAADPLGLAVRGLTIPVALVHGTNDTTVAVNATRALAEALTRADDPALYRELPEGDHGTVVNPALADGRSSIAIIVAFARGFRPVR